MRNYLFLLLTVFLFSCGGEDEPTPSFEKAKILNSNASLLNDFFVDFKKNQTQLSAKISEFKNQQNSQTLQGVKEAWKKQILSWQGIHFYLVQNLKYSLQSNEIAYWQIDTIKLVNNLNSGDFIDQAWVKTRGADQKGLFAMEFLLFNYEENSLPMPDIRLNYIQGISENIIKAIDQHQKVWEQEYQSKFLKATGTSVTESVPVLANRLLEVVDQNKNQRLGFPLALVKYEQTDLSKLESIFAKYSIPIMEQNITLVEQVYLGGKTTGFDDYLQSYGDQGKVLDEKIKKQIAVLKNQIKQVELPAYEFLLTDAAYPKLYTEWKNLLILLKTEMLSILNITPTFSDTDGD
ncbi:MAG: imelysin family protein [Flavobacteriales bacterium]|nr:imelysin family protein [Flavobacteriales bacterium]